MKKLIKGAAVALFWLAVWKTASLLAGEQLALFLPSPESVLVTLWQMLGQSALWQAVGATLVRILLGFLLGVTAGAGLGMLSALSTLANALLAPFMRALRAVPVVSFIILVFVFLKVDAIPVFISFLMVMPLLWQAARDGLLGTDIRLLEMAKVYHLSKTRLLFSVRLPEALSGVMSTAVSALGLAWKSGIAAEVISAPTHSIGYEMVSAKSDLSYDELFAVTLVVVVMSLALEGLLGALYRRTGKGAAK